MWFKSRVAHYTLFLLKIWTKGDYLSWCFSHDRIVQQFVRQCVKGSVSGFKIWQISQLLLSAFQLPLDVLDLGDGQFSEWCDVDGSFFNSDAIPIIFGKSLTSPSSRLFSLTIGNDYFSIILLILGPIILRLFTDWLGSSERKLY